MSVAVITGGGGDIGAAITQLITVSSSDTILTVQHRVEPSRSANA
jgi:hypothetical protein